MIEYRVTVQSMGEQGEADDVLIPYPPDNEREWELVSASADGFRFVYWWKAQAIKNKLVIIGYLGGKTCYLNIPREEAIKLHNEANSKANSNISTDDPDIRVTEFEFDNIFAAYDAYPIEEV